jgi:hypothetical protein
MKNQIVFSGIALLLFTTGCSGLKTMSSANNHDDAYFSSKDLSSAGIYAQGKAVEAPLTPAQRVSGSASYGQSYSDRLRNFGSSNIQQPFRPAMVVRPMAPGLFFARPMMANPNMWGYNPYNPYSFYNPYNGFYDPYGMNGMFGMNNWNPYMGYNDPYWMYYNQMYNPYCYYGGYNFAPMWNTGSSGNGTRVARGSGSSFTGARSGTANSGSTFNNTGTRRTSYNNGTSSGSTYRSGSSSGTENGTGRTSTWGSGSSSSGSSGTGRTTTWGSGSSGSSSGSSGRSSTWSSGSTPSGNSRPAAPAAQPGTSGRRR